VLETQNVPVNLQGLDTKSDTKQLITGKLVALTNGVFTTPGKIRKRNGTTNLVTSTNASAPYPTSISNGVFTANFGSEILLGDGLNLWSYSPALTEWTLKGSCPTCKVSSNSVSRSGAVAAQPQIGINSTVKMYAYVTGGAICVQVIDIATGDVLITNTSIATASVSFCIVNNNGVLTMFYVAGSTLHAVQYGNGVLVNTAISGISVDGYFDVVTDNTQFFVTYSSSGTSVNTTRLSNTYTVGATIAQTNSDTVSLPVSTYYDAANSRIWVTTINSSAGFGTCAVYAVNTACTAVVTPQTRSATTFSVNGVASTLTVIGTTAYVFWTIGSSSNQYLDCITYWATCPLSGTVTTPTLFAYGQMIVSKPWQLTYAGAQVPAIATFHPAILQPTYIFMGLFNGGPIYLAKAGSNSAGNPVGPLSTPIVVNGVVHFAGLLKYFLSSQAGSAAQALNGVNEFVLDFTYTNPNTTLLNNNLLIGGGIVRGYDGLTVNEQNFTFYPENCTANVQSGSGLAAGTYGYKFTYEWVDNQGQVHQSSDSANVSVATTSGNGQVQVRVPTLIVTDKTGVNIVIWRTAVNGSAVNGPVYYRANTVANNPAASAIVYTDTYADSLILGNLQLYTTGETPNVSPPPAVVLGNALNRTIMVPSEIPTTWWFSKENPTGSPPEFAEGFIQNCDPTGGPITAVAQMDSNLFLFKNMAIYYVAGTGPGNSGAGSTYTDAQLLPTNSGSVGNVTVLTDQGLMYQSNYGIWLLSRGLADSYLGAPVEGYNSYAVTSALLIPGTTQTRFTISNGTCLVYDHLVSQWAVFTTYNAISADIVAGVYTTLNANGTVTQESVGSYSDSGAYIPLSLTTGDLNFAGLQGFERVKKLYILGSYYGPHNLNVTLTYDFGTATQTIIPIVVGSAVTPYQFRVFMSQQKCQTIQLTISDSVLSTSNQAWDLSGLSFEVAAKKGQNKNITAGQSYG
jgi:hypothetical protein